MKRILLLAIFSIFYSLTFSQTIVPGGTISGTWTAAGSPYVVQGNLLISNGAVLNIGPGVTVNFQGNYKLLVSGRIAAVGTVTDSIRFTAANTTAGWQGIRFENTPSTNDSSRISYCSVKYGNIASNSNGAGIYVNNFSKLSIDHNGIYNCTASTGFGGGIYIQESNAVITNNNISYNHSLAGGIYILRGSPVIKNNIISHNDNIIPVSFPDPGQDPDSFGGGLSVYQSTATVTDNTITNNNSKSYGGGMVVLGGSPLVNNNIITNNQSMQDGGGVFCTGSLTLGNNMIADNSSGVSGGGIYYTEVNGNPVLTSNKVLRNTAVSSGGGLVFNINVFSPTVTGAVSNNLIANNSLSAAVQNYDGGGGIMIMNCDSNIVMSGNVIVNNNASNGGGVLCYNARPKLSNNTIANNSAAKGGALYCFNSNPALLNMLLWGNVASGEGQQVYLYDDQSDPAINYSNLQGGVAAINANGNFYTGTYQNNINANPQFVLPSTGSGVNFNGVAANWGLQTGSPAINAGRPGGGYPALDYTGKIRVVNGTIDIGAIEYQTAVPPTATVSGGGQVCKNAALPAVLFTFTYGTPPFIVQYNINGVAQTPVTGITGLQYSIAHAAPGVYTVASIKDAVSTGTGSGSATVTVIQPVAGFIINDDRQCVQGNSFIFSNTSTGALSYNWDFGDGVTAAIVNPAHIYATAGTYTVKLIVTGSAGCLDTSAKTVTVASFSINTLADSVTTYQDSLVLNAGNGFTSYLWGTGAATQNITVKKSGWYKVTVTNSDGCSAKDSSYVNFRKNRTLFIDKKVNLCAVSTVDLSVRTKSITNVIGLQGTISWDINYIRLDSVVYNNSALNVTAADVNLTNKAGGYLTYSWSDNTLAGKSVPDSTGIFTLKFSKTIAGSAVTVPVQFSSLHTTLEIDTINLISHAPVIATETAYVNGSAGFRQGPTASSIVLAACDSVVYKNKAYYDSAIVLDTIKYAGSPCDSTYKTVTINIYHAVTPAINIGASSNNILYGTVVTFNATTSFGGPSAIMQWYKNKVIIPGANSASYASSSLNAGDTIYAVFKSSYSCAIADSVISNKIGMTVSYTISGVVRSPAGWAVRTPVFNITGSINQVVTGTTTGNYSVALQGGAARNYLIKPSKNNDVNKTNGVSTLDVAIIQSHILNATLFNSPYQWIAADVNRSNTVTSIDILFIKRLILGLDNSFAGNRLWGFVDSSYGIPNITKPLPYKDSIVFAGLLANKTAQNFIAVKLGDVNFDWNPGLARPLEPLPEPVTFYYDDVLVKNGGQIRVPVRVKNFKLVLGMQFTLNYNDKVMQLEGIENNRLNIQYAANKNKEGKLAFIWNDDNNQLSNLNNNDILMELVFTTKAPFAEEDISITSDITAVELWDGNYNKHNIVKGGGKIISATGNDVNYTTESWTITPNPTQGIVQLNTRLLQEKSINIKLLSADGKTILSQYNHLPKGISTTRINLEKNARLAAGIYFIKVSGMDGKSVEKIMLVK
ncbi:MAG: PKD domain-containing protein [Ferruginibacter sp.]